MVGTTTQGTALGGGIIIGALLDGLVEKGILTKPDIRKILTRASAGLGAHIQTPEGYDASQMIDGLLRRFPE
jgi:hypothetical protein